MQIGQGLAAAVFGIAGGAALVLAAPLVASDPPAAAHPEATHSSPAAAHGTGRWAPYHQTELTSDSHDGDHGVPGPEIADRACAYFENAGFGGRRGDVRDGGNVEWLGRRMDNRISAVACHAGCRLLAYPDINFGGARRVFTGAVANVGASWNDRISALRVICEAEAAH